MALDQQAGAGLLSRMSGLKRFCRQRVNRLVEDSRGWNRIRAGQAGIRCVKTASPLVDLAQLAIAPALT